MYCRAASNISRARPRRRPNPAHTEINNVTRAVFHAPMFALNAESNACEPNDTRSTPTEIARKVSKAYSHTHPHTVTRTCLCSI